MTRMVIFTRSSAPSSSRIAIVTRTYFFGSGHGTPRIMR
jgi:hypothetical protein